MKQKKKIKTASCGTYARSTKYAKNNRLGVFLKIIKRGRLSIIYTWSLIMGLWGDGGCWLSRVASEKIMDTLKKIILVFQWFGFHFPPREQETD